jgi:hypothetical protein
MKILLARLTELWGAESAQWAEIIKAAIIKVE